MTSEGSRAGQAQHMSQSAQLVPTTGSNQVQEQLQSLAAMVEEMRVMLEQRGQRDTASAGATSAAQRGIRNDPRQLVGRMAPTTVPSTYPSVKYPKESPPLFRGTVDSFIEWVKDFEEYCNLHDCFPAFGNRIDLDAKRPYESYSLAVERGISEGDFRRVLVARWALVKASRDPKFKSILASEGVPYKAYDSICELFRLDTATRTLVLMKQLNSMCVKSGEHPCDVLFRMDETNRQLTLLRGGMTEEILLTTFLGILPDEYELEKRNLMLDKPLDRPKIQSALSDRFLMMTNGASSDQSLKVNVSTKKDAAASKSEGVSEHDEWTLKVSCESDKTDCINKLSVWHCDSGSSSHLTNSRRGMVNFRSTNRRVRSASGHYMPCVGIGDVKVAFVCEREDLPGAKKNVIVMLHDVLYVPSVQDNLFSLRAMDALGHRFVGENGTISLFGGQLKFPIRGKLYSLRAFTVTKKLQDGALRNRLKIDSDGNPLDEETRQALLAPGKYGSNEVNWNVFHASQAHANASRLKATAKSMGVKLTGTLTQCQGCSVAKGLRAPIPKSTTSRSTERLGRVFIDLSGRKEIAAPGGKRYAMVLRDDFSRYSWVYYLESKSDAHKALRRFLADVRNEGSVKIIRTDGGAEFKGEFQEICDKHQIKREFSPPNSPQYNGCVERGLAILEVTSRAARIQAKNLFHGVKTLPEDTERLWSEAMNWACWSVNATATAANAKMKSPFELYHGRLPVNRVIPFLQPGYYHRSRQRKIENRGAAGFFMGPAPNFQEGTMRFLDARTRNVVVTRDVTWLPTVTIPELGGTPSMTPSVEQGGSKDPSGNCDRECPNARESGDSESSNSDDSDGGSEGGSDGIPKTASAPEPVPEPEPTTAEPTEEPCAESSAEPSGGPSPSAEIGSQEPESTATKTARRQLSTYIKGPGDDTPRSYGRTRSQTRRLAMDRSTQGEGDASEECKWSVAEEQVEKDLDEATRAYCAFVVDDQPTPRADGPIGKQCKDVGPEPSSYRAACDSEHSNVWKDAMRREVEGLVNNDTFIVSKLPPGRRPIAAKWVYTWKTNHLGEVVKGKSRLVAKGFMQREGVDFLDTFSPTPVPSSIRMISIAAVQNDWSLSHWDIEQAFVQSKIDRDIFLKLPEGCDELSGKIVKLNRSLYGLRQSPRVFHKLLMSKLVGFGLERFATDPCVFRLMDSDKKTVRMIVGVYVDDLVVTGEASSCKTLREYLNGFFPTKDLGCLSYYLGCEYDRDFQRGTLTITQTACIDRLVNKFDVKKTSPTPASSSVELRPRKGNEPKCTQAFREAVGGLMWIANATRPDISNAVREVARHSHDPSKKHWRAALKIIEYLKETRTMGITYKKSPSCRLVAYADSSFAENKDDRRSVSGGAILCAGAVVSWFSRTQHCVTLSTTESEYVSLAETVKELMFLYQLCEFIQPGFVKLPITIFEDNDGAVKLAENPICTNRTKHIDVRYHFIREKVEDGTVRVVHVESRKQTADGLTKNLPQESFAWHRRTLLNLGA